MQSSSSSSESAHPHDDHADLISAHARSGLKLFAVYFIAYALFIAIATFEPELMQLYTFFGPNLAIVYGFGLIIGAILIALVYMWRCKRNTDRIIGAANAKDATR